MVKNNDADRGRGVGVELWADPDTNEAPSGPGPYLVQRWVPGDGVDRKLYVVGSLVAGLLKPRRTGKRSGTVFDPGERLSELAVAAGRALQTYGIDVIEGPDGPVVVDVNAFPSCHGVPGAAAAMASTLLDTAARASAVGRRPLRTR